MEKINIGCIGCGFALEGMYGPTLKYMERGQLTAVADQDESRLNWAKKTYGIPRLYSNMNDLISDKEIQAVIVAIPTKFHLQVVRQAAESGKHILCEKPLGRTVEECEEMIKVCRKNNVQLMVGFQKRFNKSMRLAKEVIDRNELGKIFMAEAKWSRPFPVMDKKRVATEEHEGWRHKMDTMGGIFQDMGSHTIDVFRWWLGEVTEVYAEPSIVDDREQLEDTVVATCRHAGGAIALHWIGYVHETPIEEYRVHGTRATMIVRIDRSKIWTTQDPFSVTIHRNGDTIEDISPQNLLNLDMELKQNAQYLREIECLAECIQTGKPVSPSGEDGKKAAEVVSGAYLSWWKEKKVHLPLTEAPDLAEMFSRLKNTYRFD